MRVIGHAPQAWFLFEEGESLFLDANCNHGAFGYSFLIELSPEERAQYQARGRGYLDWLAQAIQDSAPITGKGPYAGRDVSSAWAEQTKAAFEKWRATSGGPGP